MRCYHGYYRGVGSSSFNIFYEFDFCANISFPVTMQIRRSCSFSEFSLFRIWALLLMISLFKNNGGFSFVLDSLSKLSVVWRKDALDEESILIRNTVYAFLLCLIYPALIITIGFLPSTIIFIFLIMRVLGSKVLNSTLFSVALGGGLYYIFAIVIGVYLPTGKLWEFFLN